MVSPITGAKSYVYPKGKSMNAESLAASHWSLRKEIGVNVWSAAGLQEG
jgi:hypothetical protein